ncbi:hypothetical protein ACF1AE_22740 [Streptomyces sp. NPDC014986]|uniref:hypothetical protein n=1 Tax=Streptomyces sp. NPDC014986 TaxID=3364934 RepID=UPI0037013C27
MLRLPAVGEVAVLCRSGRTVAVRHRAERTQGRTQVLILAVPADRASGAERSDAPTRPLLHRDRAGFVPRDRDAAVVPTGITQGAFAGPSFPVGSRLADVMHPPDATGAEAALRGVPETGEAFAGRDQRVRTTRSPYGDWAWTVSAARTEDRRGRSVERPGQGIAHGHARAALGEGPGGRAGEEVPLPHAVDSGLTQALTRAGGEPRHHRRFPAA